jgi:hypothetical protein
LTFHLKNKRSHILKYIKDRSCHKGGYCFYRQEEPNLSDTYFALGAQKILGIEAEDEKTRDFILNTQFSDGSFFSIVHAYYAIHSLNLLNTKPLYSPKSFILQNLQENHPKNLRPGISSVFRKLFLVIGLMETLKLILPSNNKKQTINFILSFKNQDLGFGVEFSTLLETTQAIIILKSLEFPFKSLNTSSFVDKCEHSIFGFTNIPFTSLSYLEYLHAGVVLSQILNYEITYSSQCQDFILNCQTSKGGFARSTYGGIATLENTFYAVNSLNILY